MDIENMEITEYRKMVGIRIKEMREKYGLQKNELAEKIGVVPGNVYNYEVGKAIPQLPTFVKLAELFHTTVDYLTLKTDDPAPRGEVDDIDVEKLVNKVWKYKGVELTEEEKMKVYNLLKNGLDLIK
ncbi:helix-turn-helix domain-containing protein [Paenibacillus alvei]|uniref:helix-turn-helix domain-containing protein n=1 Tax=Paenibacillus alvei TaxID=44250 RepID=UPI002280404E|nr:helix-turn-helix transcriptional regulator [Paenibacillus alvei]MCY7487943.1 helix-turn-helix domain-containing protein [Paenibacillus alvei]